PLSRKKSTRGRLGRAIFLGMKDRVACPYNVIAVAHQPARAEVPVSYAPIRLKHEDRMVGDALHKQSKAFFAAPQCAGLALGALRRCPVVDGGGDPNAQDNDGGAGEEECERCLTD